MTPLLRGGALIRPGGDLDHHFPIPSREPTAIPLSPMPDPVGVGVGVGVGGGVGVGVGGGGLSICMHVHTYIYRAGRIHIEEGPGTRLRR